MDRYVKGTKRETGGAFKRNEASDGQKNQKPKRKYDKYVLYILW